VRIIAGKYRGRNLKSPPSLEVRPTSDRLRETLFNILAPRIAGSRFLDLCAGSGAVGIEALSRDAEHATFVDRSRKMCALIKANLELCRIEPAEYKIVSSQALEYLKQARETGNPWDIIFFDPPYADDYLPVLRFLGAHKSQLLNENGLVVVEHHHKNNLVAAAGSIIQHRTVKQGESAISFYQAEE
jgi:16S rRNA (guanine(966)-N(2))-methyltransferase RsmD